MKRTIVLFDMLYFLAFNKESDFDKIINGLAQAKAKPVYSPLQIFNEYSGTEQIVSVDAFFDYQSGATSEIVDKFSWTNLALGTVVWAYPWDELPSEAIKHWSMDEDVQDGGKVRCIRKSYPSQDLLNSSEVFVEFSKYAFDRLPYPAKNLLRSNGLIPIGAERLQPIEFDTNFEHLKMFGTESFNPYSYFSKV